MNSKTTIDTLINELEAFEGNKLLVDTAGKIFEFTRFLLDDDKNLTRTGNLNSKAKEALRRRTLELLGSDLGESEETQTGDDN